MIRTVRLQSIGIMKLFRSPGGARRTGIPSTVLVTLCACAAICAPAALQLHANEPENAPEKGTRIVSFDKNGDKRPDKWAVFVDGIVTEIAYDRNHDGKPDFWEYLNPNGRMARTEADNNHDGKPDLVVFYSNGHLSFKIIDDDFDSVPDRVVYFDGDERTGLSSEEFTHLKQNPEAALDPATRPARRASAPRASGIRKPKPVIARPGISPAAVPSEAEDPAFFPLGPDFLIRVPVPGGAAALSENRTWMVEREPRLFRWPDDGTGFELQNTPTQGAIRIRYQNRDDPGSQVTHDGLERRLDSYARRAFGRLLHVNESGRQILTALGPGRLGVYTVKYQRQSYRVSLCAVAAKEHWIFFLAAAPRDTHTALESALLEMLQGIRIG